VTSIHLTPPHLYSTYRSLSVAPSACANGCSIFCSLLRKFLWSFNTQRCLSHNLILIAKYPSPYNLGHVFVLPLTLSCFQECSKHIFLSILEEWNQTPLSLSCLKRAMSVLFNLWAC
jgi:hypothetical protein